MNTVLGKLEYLGWQRPWDVGGLDVSARFWDVAESLQGRRAEHTYHRDGYTLRANPEATRELRHGGRGQGAGLFGVDGAFAFTSVASYLEWALCALNGRTVSVSHDPGSVFWIEAAAFEEVPGVRYFGDGNMARLDPADPEAFRRVCKPGAGADCCIFMTAGADGISCAKFSGGMARHLLDRKAAGAMSAGRIGNCRNVGREGAEPV